MLTTTYAKYYNIAPQGENESDAAFKDRVSGILINAGHIIEAHEAAQDSRYDDPDKGGAVMMGIMGAVAMAVKNVNYGTKGSTVVGDQIAAGAIATSQRQKPSLDELMLYGMLQGWM